MLTAVPTTIASATRQVVLRHPNSQDCTVWRKQVKRVEADPETGDPSVMGGSPTLGGMGVLRSEDEDEFEYIELGAGKCLPCGVFQPNDLNERDDAPLQQPMQEAQVESLAEVGQPGHFIADTTDLVLVTPGLGVVLAYEVASLGTGSNIPPYTRKLVLNPRDDLHHLEPFLPEA